MATGSLLDRKIEEELQGGKVGRIAAIRRSRSFRTFVRDKAAVVATCIIAVYISVALLIVGSQLAAGLASRVGLDLSDTLLVRELSLDASLQRVGPDGLPGFFETAEINDRLAQVDFYVDRVARALDRSDPQTALDAIEFAERTVVDEPVDDVRARVATIRDEIIQINEGTYADREVALDDIAFGREDLKEASDEAEREELLEEIAQAQDDLEVAEAALLAEIAELEASVDELLPVPGGVAGVLYDARVLLGTDKQGRSILWRAIYSIRVATQVGLVSAIIAVCVGAALGAAGGFFGGWVDHAVVWLYSTLSSVPYIVLLTVVAFVFSSMELAVPFTGGTKVSQTLIPMYVAFGVTFWIAPCRQIRGEAIKIRSLDYVQSATSVGAGRLYILRRHIIPNVLFLVFINFSLIFIGAIKSEVILSFLGIGVQGQPSWGVMISESKSEVLNGFFWQIGTATAFMFGLVLAFNVFSDALQDAFDPKHAR
ncbi:MAG: ABC transporter permease [Planctomycetota bacterium]